MKVPILKPRNPFVPAAKVRSGAGKHKDKKKEDKSKPLEPEGSL
jgi:hypothetical protein